MKILILISIALVSQVQSWWENGHMLTAQVAKILLEKENPKVFERANEIVTSLNSLAYEKDNTFVQSSCWADDIKSPAMNFWDAWHFYGRPVNPDGVYLVQDSLQREYNAITALERAMLELDDSDSSEITLQKAIFMRYVIHIVGDVHQPLHSVNMFNATFDGPNGDMGANLLIIEDKDGLVENLHAFWDQGAEYFQQVGDNWIVRPMNETATEYMENWALELMTEYPEEYFGNLGKNLDPYVWTKESWEFASNSTYPWVKEHNVLSEEYQKNAVEICKQRVVLAGHRLANTLVALYKDYIPQESEFKQNKPKHVDFHTGFEIHDNGKSENTKKQGEEEKKQFNDQFVRKFMENYIKEN